MSGAHKMADSLLNHGETQCIYCSATNREIAFALGPVCPSAPEHVRSDHGTGEQAIEWILNHSPDGCVECDTFLRAWQHGDLAEWPEFYLWLDAQPAGASS